MVLLTLRYLGWVYDLSSGQEHLFTRYDAHTPLLKITELLDITSVFKNQPLRAQHLLTT